MKHSQELLYIATLGKSVGLKGDMKLHIHSDFPEQFVSGAEFYFDNHQKVKLASVNLDRGIVRIEGCNTPEDAKRLTNKDLYTTYEATRQHCKLDEGEHFWFDIIGCQVVEDGRELGRVADMDRLGAVNYLLVETDNILVARGYSKTFLIPYQPPFVLKTDTEKKIIEVTGGLDLLEAS